MLHIYGERERRREREIDFSASKTSKPLFLKRRG
jgi:hypothetical protein